MGGAVILQFLFLKSGPRTYCYRNTQGFKKFQVPGALGGPKENSRSTHK